MAIEKEGQHMKQKHRVYVVRAAVAIIILVFIVSILALALVK